MNLYLKKFIRTNILTTLLLGVVGAILFFTVLTDWFHPAMPIIVLVALVINLLVFWTFLGKKNSSFNLMQAVIISFGLKFFSYIGMVLILVLVEKNKTALFTLVIFIFVLYMVYTVLEVKAFSEYAKKVKN